jgi:hypothetical protein
MPDNPYEPPAAPIADERALAMAGSGTFELGQCLSDAWEDTWSNFPLWLGVMLVAAAAFVLSGITVIGILLVWPVLGWGMTRFYLNMTDQRASFGDLFSGFSNYSVALTGPLLLALAFYGLGLIGQSVQMVGQWTAAPEVMLIGIFVNLAWTFGVMVRLYFGILFLVDRELGPMESLQASWEGTQGQTFKLIGLLLLNVVVILAGVLVFVIGVIPATVMSYLMWTSAYRQMTGREAEPAGAFAPPSY